MTSLQLTVGFLGGTVGGFIALLVVPLTGLPIAGFKLALLVAAVGGFSSAWRQAPSTDERAAPQTEATVTLTSNFPRLGLATSRLGFGGAAMGLTNYLGHYDAAKSRDVSLAAVRRAVERGITCFDTAPGYERRLSAY